MIHEATINATLGLSQKLTKKGIMVSAIPATPLATMVSASYSPEPYTPGEISFDVHCMDVLQRGAMSKDVTGVCQHDLVTEEIVTVVARTVQNNLNMARSVVKPLIRELAEKSAQLLDAHQNLKSSLVSVQPDFWDNIWTHPLTLDMVSRYEETSVRDVSLGLKMPALSGIEIRKLAQTGARNYDAIIQEWLEKIPNDRIEHIFSRIFTQSHDTPGHLSLLPEFNAMGRDAVLLTTLLARTLLNDPPENVNNSLTEYKEMMASILAQAGRQVLRVLRDRERLADLNRIIIDYPPTKSTLGEQDHVIKVNGDIYNRFLSQGGSPEAVIGAWLEGDVTEGGKTLIEHKARYETIWRQRQQLLETTNRFNRLNHAYEAVTAALIGMINEMDEDDTPVTRDILRKRAYEQVKLLKGNFYEDWIVTAQKLICTVMFPHTDAYAILRAIDRTGEQYPEMDVREVALLATIEYVALWVAKLCKVEYRQN